MKREKYKALNALSCAAMSLPGMVSQPVSAETVPDKTTASYRYTQYSEADQPASAFSNSVARYDISVHQFLISGAASKDKGYSFGVSTETMSGASPWYVANLNGEPVQVMSGATIEEERIDLSAGLDFYGKESKLAVGVGHSSENDYSSFSGSVSNSKWFNGKNTTIDMSLAMSFDDIEPTAGGTLLRPVSESKNSLAAAVGTSHVVNKTLLLGASFNYAVYDGFLSDPYKWAEVAGAIVADSRPDVRKQAAFNIQARRFFSNVDAALHSDYRFFSTDWGTTSHTLNVAWYQNFGDFQVVPRIRYYNQSAANFYRHFYTQERADGYYSSDYRLSAYSAISFRLKGSWDFGSGTLHATFESYESSGSGNGLQTGTNPGLVDFSFLTVGFDFRW